MAGIRALSFLLFCSTAVAQLLSVTPAKGTIELMAYSANGPFGPVRRGLTVTLAGSGTVSWSDTCYGAIHTNYPDKWATLPATIRVVYGQPGKSCDLQFTGSRGGTAKFTASVSLIPASSAIVSTDMLGRELSSLGYCAAPNDGYRMPRTCTLQQLEVRPGGDFQPPPQGSSYEDRTYGAMVVNQGDYTRSYMAGNQISYDRQYVVVWNGTAAVLHKIDAVDNSGDLVISGVGGVCSVGSSSNIGLGTSAATATVGFCLDRNGGVQQDIRKFSFAGGVLTDLGVIHRHPAAMTAGLFGSGQAAMDGWLPHFDDNNQLCLLNWFSARPSDVCVKAPLRIRNLIIGPYPSRSTGLHYIWAGSDQPNTTTAYAFHPATRTITITGWKVPVIDSPKGSAKGAKWFNGTCTEDVDCTVGAHHNTVHWGGEPRDCGTGRGRIQFPDYVDGGSCVKGPGWNNATGRDIDAVGGPVSPAISPYESYYVGSRAPVAVTTSDYGGHGLIPAWRIASCSATAGVATCTLAPPGNLDAGSMAAGSPIYVDGFPESAFNGRFALTDRTSTTFRYSCGTCNGATTPETGSLAVDLPVAVQRPGQDGAGGVRICRPGLGHCRTVAVPLNVSYGAPAEGATGNWVGFRLGALGFQALTFPTTGQWGERVCWVTDFGRLEKTYVACALTGRPDLGLAPFDLDENTPDSCFSRAGKCLSARTLTPNKVTFEYVPTNSTFTCDLEASTRADFGTITGTSEAELVPSAGGRRRAISGLKARTRYWIRAKCGPSSGRIWDYAVLQVTTP